MYTLEQTKVLLDAQVAKKGADYVYPARQDSWPSCVYFEGDTPSCIVGHVFADIGLTPAEIEETSFDEEPEEVVGLFDKNAQRLLFFVQSNQDEGTPWGVAVDSGYLTVEEMIAEEER
jgi:hypothetical protein